MEHRMVMITYDVGTRSPGRAGRVMAADHLSHTARFVTEDGGGGHVFSETR